MSEPNPHVSLQKLADHVTLVTITRPEARNAVSPDVARGLDAAITATDADDDTWVVILTGTGGEAFCAGADLKAISAGRGHELRTERGGFAGFVHAPKKKPWIAAVNGAAFAGGCELVLACDLVVAVPQARFALPEVKRGLIASAGGLYRLPRALPPAVAREMILTGDPLPADRAHALGMVNLMAPDAASLIDTARALAARITANAPIAVRESLGVARQAFDRTDAELARLSDEGQARNMTSEDFKEGPRAFIEKRAPRWQGR
ncbi:MAG: enoyl-CoA hydratase-related protein [Aquabacterium sp.]